jgi:NitT/TauT family transport system ATP-binding protein
MNAPTVAGCFVRLDRVSKFFEHGGAVRPVFRNVTLDVRAGEIVSIVGRSGVGKSTLLRVISGLVPADSGEVTIGSDGASQARVAKAVGFMPQSPALLPWLTVYKNVELVQRVNARFTHELDVKTALRSVGLSEFEHAFPAQLSGGMQHRVALARALAVGGPLLVLDEPFASLDEITRASLYELLLQTWRDEQRTIIVVTHNLDEALLLSDRIVVLSGSPAEVTAVVSVQGDRPRRQSLDRGAYAAELQQLRDRLAEVAP